MQSCEVIIQTRQAVQLAVNTNRLLIESLPPVQGFQLAPDLFISNLPHDTAQEIMDCCDPRCFGFSKPVRQTPQLYAFLRVNESGADLWDWKPDERLQQCVALSRLAHPTSIPFAYHAKIKLNDEGKLQELIPFDNSDRYAWIAERDGRDWLTASDMPKLRELVSHLPLSLPARVSRAFWYHERAARNYFADVRWALIATALEALVHTDRTHSTAQFTSRTAKIAVALNCTYYDEGVAASFYDMRSQIAHGQGMQQVDPQTNRLYVFGEDLLRTILSTSILDSTFAASFLDKPSILARWAK